LDDIIKERRVEFAMEYTNWYDMVSWYCYKPEKMLNYFNAQQRSWTTASITKDADGNLIFEDTTAPAVPVVVTANNIFFPYPENDLIQKQRLKEAPQAYPFNNPS